MRALLLASILLASAAPAFAQSEQDQLRRCVEKIDVDAEAAYQDGLTWLSKGNRPMARQCTALALIALGEEAEGAARLEELANAADGGSMEERAVYLAQSGNAWLMAGMPDAAVVTLTNALKLRPTDGELYKDRARAHLSLEQWAEAAGDLDRAMLYAAGDVEAYRMRGHARMKQGELDRAWEDVNTAMQLAPTDISVLVLRGDVREAMRMRGMEDPAGLDRALEPRTRIVGN